MSLRFQDPKVWGIILGIPRECSWVQAVWNPSQKAEERKATVIFKSSPGLGTDNPALQRGVSPAYEKQVTKAEGKKQGTPRVVERTEIWDSPWLDLSFSLRLW